MKTQLIIVTLIMLISCSENNTEQKAENLSAIDSNSTNVQEVTSELDASDFTGIYEFDKHHGSKRLFIEKEYALLIDQGGFEEINSSLIGTLKPNQDTFDFFIKFDFNRPAYLLGDKQNHSTDWIDFHAYPDSTTIRLSRVFSFLPRISDTDTVLIQYLNNEPGTEFKKIK